ncbi:cobalamin biosynthesis protein CbiM [Segnochrobactraceae bacterium EtOH-i3]
MIRAAVLALVLSVVALAPAQAHRLRLFATVTGDTVSGRAFFVGGGRPNGATITVRDAGGQVIATVPTDADGAFTLRPDGPPPLTLTVDAGDGHTATTTLDAARFSPAGTPSPAPVSTDTTPASAPAPGVVLALTPAELDTIVATAVERAIRPLLEAQAEAEARIRFNDVMGGVGMLVGLTGIGLWMAARRRDRRGPPEGR